MGIKTADRAATTSPPPHAHAAHRTSQALHHDAASKDHLLARLRRIEGQVRGLQRMVEDERYCADVLTQIAAVQASLRAAAEVLLQGHLRHCVTGALRSGDPVEAEAIYRELTDLFKKYGR
jgi:DNA-binding FrmR family transcriptional regulator